MRPIIQLGDLLAKTGLSQRDCATSSLGLTALLLAFGYFTLGWATNRMKEVDDSKVEHPGSPGLICWTSATGTMSFAVFGTQFFAPLYIALNTSIYIWHVIPALAMSYILFYYWRILLKLFLLHRRTQGQMSPFTNEMLESVHDYRGGFWPCTLSVAVIGWTAIIEILVCDFAAGTMATCFFLVAVAGLGCYISLSGDLFKRAVIRNTTG